jgi:hypothetical protein
MYLCTRLCDKCQLNFTTICGREEKRREINEKILFTFIVFTVDEMQANMHAHALAFKLNSREELSRVSLQTICLFIMQLNCDKRNR